MERVLKKELLFGSVLLIASSNVALAYQFQDQYKTVINKKPYSVEVCTQGNGKTDLENFITGALIGGAIGNNIPGEKKWWCHWRYIRWCS